MIPISKVWYPNKEKLHAYIDKIYETGWVTNNGPLVQEFEKRLETYLGVKNLVCVASGSIALEMAYTLLRLKDEVITTPFTFVSTTDTLISKCLTPVYADIHSEYMTLDPDKIEGSITDKTSGIVPVHVYGNTCQVDEIMEVAKKNNLKIVFDAAHAFGVNYKGQSVLNYGDISTLSFNAVKLFHTIEGGALIINDDRLVEEARLLGNFGIDGYASVKALGINAKMNEFQAAMGLCMLDDIDNIIDKRKEVFERYENGLKDVIVFQKQNENSTQNYNYFPILFETEEEMKKVQKVLNDSEIFPRRYFYPSLDTLPYIKEHFIMNISREISSRILALPIYDTLDIKDQMQIISIIKEN